MANTSCALCQEIQKGKEKIYEDDIAYAVLHPKPASLGHLVVFPKKHYQIVEQIPDYEFGHLMAVVNKISTAAFEGAGAQGTNIIIQNGLAAGQAIPHVSVHIIPRRENDGLVFQWDTKQLAEEEMSTVELQLKEETKNIGAFQKTPKAEPIKLEKKSEKVSPELSDQENYLIKQLRRIP
jgi:histidine triad (HIT) family protein